jgi:membrane protease YdiL (CAAX protease family)
VITPILAACPCGSTAAVVTLMVVGAVATAAGWYAVAQRGASIWVVFGVTNSLLAIAAILTGRVPLSPQVGAGGAAVAGLGAGLALYLATVAFVTVARRWPAFAEDVTDLYGRGAGLSLPVAMVLAVGLAAPGEELFWRGLFQQHLAQGSSRASAAAATWLVYVAANAVSRSLPVTAAAVVAGGVWILLAAWTGGALAAVLCHALWIALMLGFPPPGGARPSGSLREAG